MDLIDRLRELSAKATRQVEHLATEEATKTALVMPFIQALGYNVFDPTEVVPEFTADFGTKKGEKIDYAILRDGKPIMLFECKHCGCSLGDEHASQLYRYFSVTSAKFGILTNGIEYRIFTDLDQPNRLDAKPFLELSLFDLTPQAVDELKKFAKEGFDLDNILSTASDLKYTKGVKRILGEEAANPSDDVVRLLAGRVYSGRMTPAAREQFTKITRQAFQEFVSERVSERLKSALEREASADEPSADEPAAAGEPAEERDVVTSDEERDAYYVVKAIVREIVDAKRVVMRDAKTYCAILLDDNNRKPICRLHFGSARRFVGTFDPEKKETRHAIADLSDIFGLAGELKGAVLGYEGGAAQTAP